MSSVLIESGLSTEALHIHRELASLQEELEAIDYYHQRADVTHEAELKAILTHNRNDEMEHATMLLEEIRVPFSLGIRGLDDVERGAKNPDLGALTIGYKQHSAHDVDLYYTESLTFRVLEPAAAVELKLG